MKNFFLVASSSILILLGCGGESSMESVNQVSVVLDSDSTVMICTKDSIGIGSGNEDYVMGAVADVGFGPDGNIAVLDRARFGVRIYSPEGEFLRTIGCRGNGPGEFGMISFMTITDSGKLQLAGTVGGEMGVHCFDYSTGEWLDTERTFVPPSCLESSTGDRYVRKDITFFRRDDDIYLPVTISMYECADSDPLVSFHSDTVLFDMSRERELLELDWYGYDIASDFRGNVYVAPRSTEEALVMVFDSSGTHLRSLQLPYEPVERTPEEMEMERRILRAKAIASNENPEGLEPESCKPMITGLETDGSGNLWVLQGGPVNPTFTVLTPQGAHVCTAVLQGNHPDGASWRFHLDEYGMLAYAEDPQCGYQKIYLLDLQQGM